MGNGNRQLLAYTFPAGSAFEGQLVGALERIESGGAMRILAALFVARQPDGELVAVSMSTEGSAGMTGSLLSFRLEDAARRKATDRVLESPAGEAVRSLAASLGPGEATAGVLVEHTWALTLADAVGRIGGRELISKPVPDEADELSALLLEAVAG